MAFIPSSSLKRIQIQS